MTTQSVLTGDTVTAQGTFRDEDLALVDADSQEVTFTVYDGETRKVVFTGAATRRSKGVYYYNYTIPPIEQAYYFELEGDFAGDPQLKRVKVKAKFKI